jgi:hypothetical protein
MPKRSGTKQAFNIKAVSIVQKLTGQASLEEKPDREKSPAAVELGRLDGLKGDKKRGLRN